jgi:hypothetical protein
MAHTCCGMNVCVSEYGYSKPYYSSASAEQRRELQDEDSEFKIVLDTYVQLYQRLLHEHAGHFEMFWIAWWITLDRFLPHDSPNNLYNAYDILCNTLDNATESQANGAKGELKSTIGYGPHCEAIRAISAPILESLQRVGLKVLDQLNPSDHERYAIEILTYPRERYGFDCTNLSDCSGSSDEE